MPQKHALVAALLFCLAQNADAAPAPAKKWGRWVSPRHSVTVAPKFILGWLKADQVNSSESASLSSKLGYGLSGTYQYKFTPRLAGFGRLGLSYLSYKAPETGSIDQRQRTLFEGMLGVRYLPPWHNLISLYAMGGTFQEVFLRRDIAGHITLDSVAIFQTGLGIGYQWPVVPNTFIGGRVEVFMLLPRTTAEHSVKLGHTENLRLYTYTLFKNGMYVSPGIRFSYLQQNTAAIDYSQTKLTTDVLVGVYF